MMTFEEESATPSAPEWFVTFADMMSLLLAFFIMLAAMGSFQQPSQFHSVAARLQQHFGSNVPRDDSTTDFGTAATADDVPDGHDLHTTRPGGIIHFTELATELTEENKRALAQISRQLAESTTTIEIRGHARPVAIDPLSGLRDHWDLADRRCHNTMQFLIEQGIDSSRIRLANAGTSEPLYRGTDTTRLGQNSRVEIRIVTAPPVGF